MHAKAIENIFEKSSIPQNVIKTGNMATGGKALTTFKIGENMRFSLLILPVKKPRTIPENEPIVKPRKTLQNEAFKSLQNSPVLIHSFIAEKILVGGGIKTEFSKNNCQMAIITIIIGKV